MSGRGASVKRQTRAFSIKPRPINGLPAVAAGYSLRLECRHDFSVLLFSCQPARANGPAPAEMT